MRCLCFELRSYEWWEERGLLRSPETVTRPSTAPGLTREWFRRVGEGGVGYREPDAPKLLSACDHRRALEQVQSDLNYGPVWQVCQERALCPPIEGPHRRAAPDLKIRLAARNALDGPVAREPDVPAEDERHLVLRVAFRALDLASVAPGEEPARLCPDVGQRALKDLALDAGDRLGRDVFEAGVCAIQLPQERRAPREPRPSLEDLHLYAHLEHVRRRRHGHVGQLGGRKHLLGEFRRSRLDARLVGRARHHVGGAKSERRGHAARRTDAPRGADSNGAREAMGRLELGPQLEERGEQRREWPVVGVTSGIRFDGNV